MIKDDEVSNQRRAELQSRHIDAQIELDRSLSVRRGRREMELDQFYGPGRDALQSRISEINARLNEPGVKGLIRRSLNGRQDREELELAHQSMRNLETRIEENKQAIVQDEFQIKQELLTQQDIERDDLEVDIHGPHVRERNSECYGERAMLRRQQHTDSRVPAREVLRDLGRGKARGL